MLKIHLFTVTSSSGTELQLIWSVSPFVIDRLINHLHLYHVRTLFKKASIQAIHVGTCPNMSKNTPIKHPENKNNNIACRKELGFIKPFLLYHTAPHPLYHLSLQTPKIQRVSKPKQSSQNARKQNCMPASRKHARPKIHPLAQPKAKTILHHNHRNSHLPCVRAMLRCPLAPGPTLLPIHEYTAGIRFLHSSHLICVHFIPGKIVPGSPIKRLHRQHCHIHFFACSKVSSGSIDLILWWVLFREDLVVASASRAVRRGELEGICVAKLVLVFGAEYLMKNCCRRLSVWVSC